MFNNLTKEIITYSLIPVTILIIFNLIFFVISKLSKKKQYRYNYLIKIGLLLIIGLVLPLIIGYTVWMYSHFITSGTLSNNILYMILLCVLVIMLIVLLFLILIKLYKSFNDSHEEEIRYSEIEE